MLNVEYTHSTRRFTVILQTLASCLLPGPALTRTNKSAAENGRGKARHSLVFLRATQRKNITEDFFRRPPATRSLILCMLAAVSALACVPSRPLIGCCPVSRLAGDGRPGRPVFNSDQTVIIVWDENKKQQHFIRRASFHGGGPDFGFIIPSPGRPDLQEAEEKAFRILESVTAPQAHYSNPSTWGSKEFSQTARGPSVRVIEEKHVAHFDAVVLEADSPDALSQWLKEHAYNYSPAVEEWSRPYIDKKWFFTALKISPDQTSPRATTVEAKALRMSFQTDQPLFPYREPATAAPSVAARAGETLHNRTQAPPSRNLKIYFLGNKRYQGRLEGGQKWGGRTTWFGHIDEARYLGVIDSLGLAGKVGSAKWLTVFEDEWPYEHSDSDLVFEKAVGPLVIQQTTEDRDRQLK